MLIHFAGFTQQTATTTTTNNLQFNNKNLTKKKYSFLTHSYSCLPRITFLFRVSFLISGEVDIQFNRCRLFVDGQKRDELNLILLYVFFQVPIFLSFCCPHQIIVNYINWFVDWKPQK